MEPEWFRKRKPTPIELKTYAKDIGFAEDFGPTPLRPFGFSDEQIQVWIDQQDWVTKESWN